MDDSSPNYRVKKVSFAAAYGNERIPAHLFLPKGIQPPYQTVLYFPSSYARETRSRARQLDLLSFEFIVRSGRAVIYPVYQGTFERGVGTRPAGPNATRNMQVAWTKDVFRAVDYLETRRESITSRLALLQPEPGGVLRADSGCARTADQGRRCLRWAACASTPHRKSRRSTSCRA